MSRRSQILRLAGADGHSIVVCVRPAVLNVKVDDDAYAFDAEGKLLSAFRRRRHYRRSLDNRVLVKARAREGAVSRRTYQWLARDEIESLVCDVLQCIAGVRRVVVESRCPGGEGNEAQVDVFVAALDRACGWDFAALERDRERFQAVYQRVGILPPDQYLSLVLQLTQGCHYNRCTFCSFYRGQPFRAKTAVDFRRHIDAVLDYFGPCIRLRRSIFLGEANALLLPTPRLMQALDAIHERFDLAGHSPPSMRGVYSFVDTPSAERKTAADFAALAERGLRRVYLGVESGDAELLRLVQKPGAPEDVIEAVRIIKQGGVSVAPIFMVGLGGERFAEQHAQATASLVERLPLSSGDLVYLSDLHLDRRSPLSATMGEMGIEPLDRVHLEMRHAELRTRLKAIVPPGVTVTSYDIREFIY